VPKVVRFVRENPSDVSGHIASPTPWVRQYLPARLTHEHGGIVTPQQLPSRSARPALTQLPGTVLLVALFALLIGAIAGFLLGERHPVMHTTQGRCLSAEGAISCQTSDDDGNVNQDDWTYGVPLDVAWTGDDAFHEGGRPDCLPPTGRGLSDVVRLTWVEVSSGGTGWRAVVAVEC
jgi:hypothetical protein